MNSFYHHNNKMRKIKRHSIVLPPIELYQREKDPWIAENIPKSFSIKKYKKQNNSYLSSNGMKRRSNNYKLNNCNNEWYQEGDIDYIDNNDQQQYEPYFYPLNYFDSCVPSYSCDPISYCSAYYCDHCDHHFNDNNYSCHITQCSPSKPSRIYKITIDCFGYNSESIKVESEKVKTSDQNKVRYDLIVTGSEETRMREGENFDIQKFKKVYNLPSSVDVTKLVTFMTKSKWLVIEIPLKKKPSPSPSNDNNDHPDDEQDDYVPPDIIDNNHEDEQEEQEEEQEEQEGGGGGEEEDTPGSQLPSPPNSKGSKSEEDDETVLRIMIHLPNNIDGTKSEAILEGRNLILKIPNISKVKKNKLVLINQTTLPQYIDIETVKCYLFDNVLEVIAQQIKAPPREKSKKRDDNNNNNRKRVRIQINQNQKF
jgi:hypothetical protein